MHFALLIRDLKSVKCRSIIVLSVAHPRGIAEMSRFLCISRVLSRKDSILQHCSQLYQRSHQTSVPVSLLDDQDHNIRQHCITRSIPRIRYSHPYPPLPVKHSEENDRHENHQSQSWRLSRFGALLGTALILCGADQQSK